MSNSIYLLFNSWSSICTSVNEWKIKTLTILMFQSNSRLHMHIKNECGIHRSFRLVAVLNHKQRTQHETGGENCFPVIGATVITLQGHIFVNSK